MSEGATKSHNRAWMIEGLIWIITDPFVFSLFLLLYLIIEVLSYSFFQDCRGGREAIITRKCRRLEVLDRLFQFYIAVSGSSRVNDTCYFKAVDNLKKQERCCCFISLSQKYLFLTRKSYKKFILVWCERIEKWKVILKK